MTATDRKDLERIRNTLRHYVSVIDRILKSEGAASRKPAPKRAKSTEKQGGPPLGQK